MLLAVFFLASNVIPPLYLTPGVPVTIQVLVIALMGGLLGAKWGLADYAALLIATAAGLPMMASFSGGPAAFFTPTAGFIFGWVFIVLPAGLCRDVFAKRALPAKLFAVPMFICCLAGVLLDYAAGALWFDLYSGLGAGAFVATFAGFMAYLPLDVLKCAAAAGVCAALAKVPALRFAARAQGGKNGY